MEDKMVAGAFGCAKNYGRGGLSLLVVLSSKENMQTKFHVETWRQSLDLLLSDHSLNKLP